MPPSPESKRCNLEAVSGLALATVSGGGTSRDSFDTSDHTPKLARNRSLATLFFQSITMTCVPFGEGGPLVNAVYGGGPLAMVVGWIVVLILDECVALSLAELVSRYPTASGPPYWAFKLLSSPQKEPARSPDDDGREVFPPASSAPQSAVLLSYVSGWVWLVGNWTMALSASFGFASLLAATVNLFHPELIMSAWQLLLVLYAMCLLVLVICKYANAFLPLVDTICAALNVLCVLAILVALSATAKAGRRSAADTLGYYDKTLSGWGDFSFFIGMLPPAYTFAVVGMMCSMAEECDRAAVKVPAAMSLCIPIAGLAGFLFILPICVTMPPLEDILRAPFGQVMPYIFHQVTGSTACALALLLLILILLASAIVGVTVVASRYTWAFSRDKALPGAAIWSQIHPRLGVPTNALYLITAVQMILGLISLGNTTAFNAFVSMSVIALSLSYGLPIAISMWCGRKAVSEAQWRMPNILGWTVNAISILWITFECFLFSMPVTKALPHPDQMNYASVVLVGMGVLVAAWYVIHARKVFKGPSISL